MNTLAAATTLANSDCGGAGGAGGDRNTDAAEILLRAVSLRLYDVRTEVREAAITCIGRVALETGSSMAAALHSDKMIWPSLWSRKSDEAESVRMTAIDVVRRLIDGSEGKHYKSASDTRQDILLSEAALAVVNQTCGGPCGVVTAALVAAADPESEVRRAGAEMLAAAVAQGCQGSEQSQPEWLCALGLECSASQRQNDESKESAAVGVCSTIGRLAEDTDWEIKLIALSIIADRLGAKTPPSELPSAKRLKAVAHGGWSDQQTVFTSYSDTVEAAAAQRLTKHEPCGQVQGCPECFEALGGVKVLVKALDDHDRLVRAFAARTLAAVIAAANEKATKPNTPEQRLNWSRLAQPLNVATLEAARGAAEELNSPQTAPWDELFVVDLRPQTTKLSTGFVVETADNDEINALGCY